MVIGDHHSVCHTVSVMNYLPALEIKALYLFHPGTEAAGRHTCGEMMMQLVQVDVGYYQFIVGDESAAL